MSDRLRPVWLTEEQAKIVGDLLSAHVQGYSAELDAVVDPVLEQIEGDPTPWLTVDDNGRAVRMVPVREAGETLQLVDGTWTDWYADGQQPPGAEPVRRAVPVDQDGDEGA